MGFLSRLARRMRRGDDDTPWPWEYTVRTWDVTLINHQGGLYTTEVKTAGSLGDVEELAMGDLVRECPMWKQYSWVGLRVDLKSPIPKVPPID